MSLYTPILVVPSVVSTAPSASPIPKTLPTGPLTPTELFTVAFSEEYFEGGLCSGQLAWLWTKLITGNKRYGWSNGGLCRGECQITSALYRCCWCRTATEIFRGAMEVYSDANRHRFIDELRKIAMTPHLSADGTRVPSLLEMVHHVAALPTNEMYVCGIILQSEFQRLVDASVCRIVTTFLHRVVEITPVTR
jgi:hypothetical protein